jgi:hypothetical protein
VFEKLTLPPCEAGLICAIWPAVDEKWEQWTNEDFLAGLNHPIAIAGFTSDFSAMKWADACVPGYAFRPKSAHLEAGYFVGAQKPLFILLSDGEPELMYKMATQIFVSSDQLRAGLVNSTAPET